MLLILGLATGVPVEAEFHRHWILAAFGIGAVNSPHIDRDDAFTYENPVTTVDADGTTHTWLPRRIHLAWSLEYEYRLFAFLGFRSGYQYNSSEHYLVEQNRSGSGNRARSRAGQIMKGHTFLAGPVYHFPLGIFTLDAVLQGGFLAGDYYPLASQRLALSLIPAADQPARNQLLSAVPDQVGISGWGGRGGLGFSLVLDDISTIVGLHAYYEVFRISHSAPAFAGQSTSTDYAQLIGTASAGMSF